MRRKEKSRLAACFFPYRLYESDLGSSSTQPHVAVRNLDELDPKRKSAKDHKMRYETRELLKVHSRIRQTPGYLPFFSDVLDELLVLKSSVKGYAYVRQGTLAARLGKSRQWINVALQWLRNEARVVKSHQQYRSGWGGKIFGACKYYVAADPGHADWMDRQWKEKRITNWARRIVKKARPAISAAPDAGLGSGGEGWARAGDQNLIADRCQAQMTLQSNPESYPDNLVSPGQNLASPALQRLLKEKRWKG
jgi:hypothetical protein